MKSIFKINVAQVHKHIDVPHLLDSSPVKGFSTLITSAPRSAKIWLQNGPAIIRVKSSTRMFANGYFNGSRVDENLTFWITFEITQLDLLTTFMTQM